jgi:ribosomal protein S12 methylthiotransferase accessory factor
MPNLFARAASTLAGEAPESAAADVQSLLTALDYAAEPGGIAAGAETRHRARLLRAASGFTRVFELAAPDAPGLVSFGAQFDPAIADTMHAGDPLVGVSGVGVSPREAFQGCIGEGVEYLSQLQTADDILQPAGPGDPASELGPQSQALVAAFSAHRLRNDAELAWVGARRLAGGGRVLLPADLCLRRPAGQRQVKPPFPLSIGSAAGTSWDAAAVHGLLELIERDATSLWWRGGRRGRLIPADHPAQSAAQDLLRRLRPEPPARRSWMLDITSDLGIPCVAAVSCKPDGSSFAFGLAARPTLAAAVCSAIPEMCQIELADRVVEAKYHEGGEAALNAQDGIHRRRATMINADACLLLQPVAEPAEHLSIDVTDAGELLSMLVKRLAQFGIETFGLDLTRPRLAIPVARIVTAGLQLEPSELITPRLADMIRQTGGGAAYTGGVSLI